jgi:hypothetical protein
LPIAARCRIAAMIFSSPGAAARAAPHVDVEHALEQPRRADVLRPGPYRAGLLGEQHTPPPGAFNGNARAMGFAPRSSIVRVETDHGVVGIA